MGAPVRPAGPGRARRVDGSSGDEAEGTMTVWLVRAGKHGEHEELALRENVATVGWSELGGLSAVGSREALRRRLEEAYPEASGGRRSNWESQLWPFVAEMKKGDLVAMPLKTRPIVVFGRVEGEYRYREDFPEGARHTREVKWFAEIPRNDIDQDLLYSMGAFMTVCRIQRNQAEERIRALLEKERTGDRAETPGEVEDERATEAGPSSEDVDLEEIALDGIRRFISRRFAGHRLTNLVRAVLEAKGYRVRQSPEGPDGGVDILAGRGELGFDEPRIAVQVKSGSSQTDIRTVRELQGAMKNYRATHGLFVSWGGYRKSVPKELPRLFFEIRLWDSEDLLREIFRHYDDLPEELQAELPLKRIWTLVPDRDDTD